MKIVLSSLALVLLCTAANAAYVRRGDGTATGATGAADEAPIGMPNVQAGLEPAGAAKDLMSQTLTRAKSLYADNARICGVEVAKTKEWQGEAHNMDFAARMAAKQKLAAALGNRVAGLAKFLKRLKKMRARLYEHIDRVNGIFQNKYKENLDNVHAASGVLKLLGQIQTEPWNPHLNPIKNFKSWSGAAPAAAEPAAAAADAEPAAAAAAAPEAAEAATTATNFLSLVEGAYNRAGPECKAATTAAFTVYEHGLKLNSMMDVSFESERAVLAKFRETLGGMIRKREAKLKALTTQLQKLQAALQAANQPFQELIKGLDSHLEHVKAACAQHAKQAAIVTGEIQAVVAQIEENHINGASVAATGTAM